MAWLAAVLFGAACSRGDGSAVKQRATPFAGTSRPAAKQPSLAKDARQGQDHQRPTIGFRSRAQFDEHFQKHGAEFGHITQQEYLREALALRDAPVGGNIEEIRRDDGTTSRFDRSTGAFLAFNRDGSIRTFFKPNDGEAYFRRQASRAHR